MIDRGILEGANEVIRFLREKGTGKVIRVLAGGLAPMTQGKIKDLTGLSWSQTNRAVMRLMKYGLAEDTATEGRALYTLTYKRKELYLLIEKIAHYAKEPV